MPYIVGKVADTCYIVYTESVLVAKRGEKTIKKNKFSENMFFYY